MSQLRHGALAGLGWGATAGAIHAGALFGATRDTLEAPGGLILGITQAAAVDAAALWLLLGLCGAAVAVTALVIRRRVRVFSRPHVYSSLAVGAIAFALIARVWLTPGPPTAVAWAGSACLGAAAAVGAFVVVPRISRRLPRLAQPGPGVVLIVPLAIGAAWGAAYARWGGGALWLRATATGAGLLALIAVLAIVGRWLAATGERARWWRMVAAVLPAPGLAAWLAVGALDARSRPPVVLITIDALRTDRLGCYGADDGLTPNLDAFAREAIVFEEAFAAAPWTADSFAAIFAGRYPRELGMAPAAPDPPRPTPMRDYRLRGVGHAPALLAEILAEAGYETAAEIANPYLDRRLGWCRGFDYFRNEQSAPPEPPWRRPSPTRALLGWRHASLAGWFARRPYVRPTRETVLPRGAPGREGGRWLTAAATRWLRERESRAPKFLWVHYMDPHEPYLPPGIPAAVRASLPPLRGVPLRCTGSWMDEGKPEPQLSEAVRDAVRTLYDYEVRYADRSAGALLDYLREAGLYEPALIVITADHGEELWDHGHLGHGHALHDEILRVPLMVKLPNASSPRRVKRQVRLIDLAPTVLDIGGVRYHGPMRGRSLMAALSASDAERPLFAEGLLYGDEQKCLRTERYKVIYHAATGRTEVYDIGRDPMERRDLGGDGKVAPRERQMLKTWITQEASGGGARRGEVQLTPDMRERLRSLGYTAD